MKNLVKKAFTKTPTEYQSNINTMYTDEHYISGLPNNHRDKKMRGIQVYYMSALSGVTATDKDGHHVPTRVEQPVFYLSVNERNEIFRLCTPVLGVVSSRMMRISGLNFHVKPIKEIEDQLVEEMKGKKSLYEEYGDMGSFTDLYVRSSVVKDLRFNLPDLKPDMSNFDNSLLRWKQRFSRKQQHSTEEIEDWLSEPNTGVTWSEFVKKWVYDIHIHGASSIYKQYENNVLQNFDVLIGGTVQKIKYTYFSSMEGYIQLIYGFEPQVFFGDEISYAQYLPRSTSAQPIIPLEALINKVAEVLMFDHKMAQEADGTVPPEKAVVVTETGKPFSMDAEGDAEIPLDVGEQKRIEEKVNTPIKNGIITFSGNNATVVDLSRADTLGVRSERQKDIREEVALVFNMSNMEVNLTGSGDTSGRATSESQEEIEAGKGTSPHVKLLEEKITRDIITARYGYGFKLDIERQKNELEEKRLDELMLNTGELTENELREKYNKSTFVGEEYDKPRGASTTGSPFSPDGSQINPFFNRQID
jgi:hypothetical protein